MMAASSSSSGGTSTGTGSGSGGAGSPCAACKFLRRKCLAGCVFAPYFPPEEPQKFANVHKVFGASNVTKLLNELPPHRREDAVSSLAYEAEARVRDPVYGCVAAISVLQRQVHRLQKELDAAHADLLRYACCAPDAPLPPAALPVAFGRRVGALGGYYPSAANAAAAAGVPLAPAYASAAATWPNASASLESGIVAVSHHPSSVLGIMDEGEGGDSSM